MDRVAFLVEGTRARIDCLLNPDSVVVRRMAGLAAQTIGPGRLTRHTQADDPLRATGGGQTELELELLFDVQLARRRRVRDVRDLTGPLWALAENHPTERGGPRPRRVRFVWGRAWNIPGVIAAVAERLEHFDGEGVPRRSWLRLRLLRAADRDAPKVKPAPTPLAEIRRILNALGDLENVEMHMHLVTGVADGEYAGGPRLDLIAAAYYGDPTLWRLLALVNDLADPLRLKPGLVLRVPVLPWLPEGVK